MRGVFFYLLVTSGAVYVLLSAWHSTTLLCAFITRSRTPRSLPEFLFNSAFVPESGLLESLPPASPQFINKAFTGSMKPGRIVPYYYKANGIFVDEDITITTLVTGNRFSVFERLVNTYQGTRLLYQVPCVSFTLFFRARIRDCPHFINPHRLTRRADQRPSLPIHFESAHDLLCRHPPRSRPLRTPVQSLAQHRSILCPYGLCHDARCRFCDLHRLSGEDIRERDRAAADEGGDDGARRSGVRVCTTEGWAQCKHVSTRQTGPASSLWRGWIPSMSHLLPSRLYSAWSKKARSTCFTSPGSQDTAAPTSNATMHRRRGKSIASPLISTRMNPT